MSRVTSFQQCVARPGSLLTEHLIDARLAIEKALHGYDEKCVQLAGLAGVCHDLAKSHTDWQKYVHDETIKKGPNHSACGAFLFSFWGYQLLKKLNAWEANRIYWLWLIRDIADHHSKLSNVFDDQWRRYYEWDKFDLSGMASFIYEQYPMLRDIAFSDDVLEDWVDDVGQLILEVQDELDLGYNYWEPLTLMNHLQNWRSLTTALIAGDRFDVSEITTTWFEHDDHVKHERQINCFCQNNRHHPLSVVRMNAQQDIMQQLKRQPDHRFYTLSMPTGYGKTMTALKMATWFGQTQNFKKIVYVAPYLTILEQTSRVFEDVFKRRPLEHHSLAVLDSDHNQRAGHSQLAMESWAHPIVCTSFQQFNKALFPRRSQDVLRRAFLRDAVVIIDEPQIFNPEIWNVFLCGLEAFASQNNLKVIFLTATMPPFRYGLTNEPASLYIKPSSNQDRYTLRIEERQDETTLSLFLKERQRSSQAVILNTIEDAYRVYSTLEAEHVYLIHGLMTPLHKKIVVSMIQSVLNRPATLPVYVISTQVLEAGVDVSFQHVARALPILPSLVQAAGRVNRHQESEKIGLVTTFPFYRSGEIDTRSFIYPKALQQITDELLQEKLEWRESELTAQVQRYYEEMFRQNTYEAGFECIRGAYEGDWQGLSSLQVFKQSFLTLPLFVPWDPEDNRNLPETVHALQKRFRVQNGHDVYARYLDRRYMESLTFEERKQFMILFHHYVLDLPVKKALLVASKEDFLAHRVPILQDTDAYDGKIGLKAPFDEYDNFI